MQKKKKNIVCISIQGFFILFLWGIVSVHTLLAQLDSCILVDKIVANVGKYIILQSEIEAVYQQKRLLQSELSPLDLKYSIVKKMLLQKMLLSKADQEKIKIDSEVLKMTYQQMMQDMIQQCGSQEKLEKHYGISEEKIKESCKEELLIEKMYTQIIENVVVTPKEVQHFFESLPASEVPYYPTAVEVLQLVRYPKVHEKEKQKNIARLNLIKEQLQAGADFAQLAKQYSEDSSTASQGGELGFVHKGDCVVEYETAALSLQPGEIAGPVETEFGFHLIQLINRTEDGYTSRHILIQSTPSAEDIDSTITYLDNLRTAIIQRKTTFEKAVKDVSEDNVTAEQGGLLTGTRLGKTSMSMAQLDPDVFFAIESLTPGTIADPAVFTTPTGKQGVRLLLLKKRIEPHSATLEQDYADIYQRALARKQYDVLETWFATLKEELGVVIDPEYQPTQESSQ